MRLNPFAKPSPPDSAAVLRAIEATPALRDIVVEAYGGSVDPDANLSATQGGSAYYRGLLGSNRDLPEYDAKRAVETAYWLADMNPIAKRVVNIWKNYTIGSGLTYAVDADDDTDSEGPSKTAEAIQKCLDRFWDDPHNRMKLKLPSRMRALSITGEQCWPVVVDDKGSVRVGYVDPATIKAVLKDPENGERTAAIMLDAKTADGNDIVLKVVTIGSDPNAEGYGRRLAAAKDEPYKFPGAGLAGGDLEGTYAGTCWFWRVNSLPNATRGRSDLLPAIDWIDAYDQVLMNDVDRTLLQTVFVWDVAVDGDEAAIKRRAADIGTRRPKPGTTNVHNLQEVWTAVNPDLHMQDAQAGADLILSYIATALDMPKTWLNGLMDANRATAEAMPEPTYMALEERQTFVQDMITEVLAFVLDQAEMAGAIPKRDGVNPEPWPVSVRMPELVRKDIAPAAAALGGVVTALAAAQESHIIDEQVAQEAGVLALGNLGLEVDIAKMRERIATEKAENDAKAALAPYGDTGVANGDNGTDSASGGGAMPPGLARQVAEALAGA